MSGKLTRRSFLATAPLAAALAGRGWGRSPKPAGDPMAAGTSVFALDLYAKLREAKGNVFFSPFSVSTALAMTAAGAKGDTLAQMRTALHLPESADRGFGALLAAVNGAPGAKRGFELSAANAIWAQQGYPWRDEFRTTVRDGYAAGLKEADFKADPEAGRKAINAWVEEQTRQKIKELFAPGVIDNLTRLVLANAVYFKGTWQKPFDKGATKAAPFTTAVGAKRDVPLMALTGRFAYAEADDAQTLELPYAGGEVSMVVVLPRKPDGLPAVEKALAPDRLTGGKNHQTVRVFLPRFKVEGAYTLNDPLQALGMKLAFDADKADFTGMVRSLPEGPLYITHVAHKAFVDVNEEGTEAAAATGVVVGVKSARPEPPKEFRADRPFLFALRHVPTGAVLFLGRYEAP